MPTQQSTVFDPKGNPFPYSYSGAEDGTEIEAVLDRFWKAVRKSSYATNGSRLDHLRVLLKKALLPSGGANVGSQVPYLIQVHVLDQPCSSTDRHPFYTWLLGLAEVLGYGRNKEQIRDFLSVVFKAVTRVELSSGKRFLRRTADDVDPICFSLEPYIHTTSNNSNIVPYSPTGSACSIECTFSESSSPTTVDAAVFSPPPPVANAAAPLLKPVPLTPHSQSRLLKSPFTPIPEECEDDHVDTPRPLSDVDDSALLPYQVQRSISVPASLWTTRQEEYTRRGSLRETVILTDSSLTSLTGRRPLPRVSPVLARPIDRPRAHSLPPEVSLSRSVDQPSALETYSSLPSAQWNMPSFGVTPPSSPPSRSRHLPPIRYVDEPTHHLSSSSSSHHHPKVLFSHDAHPLQTVPELIAMHGQDPPQQDSSQSKINLPEVGSGASLRPAQALVR